MLFKKRTEVILLVYGRGGHSAQMKRFLNNNNKSHSKTVKYITLSNEDIALNNIVGNYFCLDARDKYHWYKNLFISVAYILISVAQMCRLVCKYRVVGMISTGPGLAVIPGLFCRLFNKKVVFFEDWCRFNTPSIAGRIMYTIANVFFIQHESVRKFYPKSIYMGRL